MTVRGGFIGVWHVDADLVVAEKPAGLLAVPGRGEAGRDCLSARVAALWPDARVVHRLDMATSGLMLLARGAAMQRQLSMAFAARRIAKRYVAVVHGLVERDEGEIDAPLAADWPHRPRQHVDLARGRPSLTRWRVRERDAAAGRTRLELEPVTGRTHQLRVHLRHIRHPIVGDALYADDGPVSAASPSLLSLLSLPAPPVPPAPPTKPLPSTPLLGSDAVAQRLLLHAEHLAFEHPRDGRTLAIFSAAPF